MTIKRTMFVAVFLALLCSTAASHAVTIPTVPIGNAGNLPDSTGLGSVANNYRIGKTEITNAQYVEFLNAVAASDPFGLYDTFPETEPAFSTHYGIVRSGVAGNYTYAVKPPAVGHGPGGTDYRYEDKPVVFVGWDDAVRFANWLHNGQPSGPQDATTTEDGAYTLNGAVTTAALNAVTRNPAARWWLPSEDEWYKAAYHKNDGVTGNYWDFPTGTDSPPDRNLPENDTGNSANYGIATGSVNFTYTDAGAYTLSESPYGTLDQGGNAYEWTEGLWRVSSDLTLRLWRGGNCCAENGVETLRASYEFGPVGGDPATGFSGGGFRVATSVPEPSTICLGTLAVIGVWWSGRRRSYPGC